MGKGHRQGRLGEEIRKILSEMLLRDLKDPRLLSGMVSVSAVEVTSDGSYATIFITVLGLDPKNQNNEQEEDVITALRSAKGLIKREIGRQVKLRHTPDLIFKIDKSMEYGRHIDEIIDQISVDDDNDAEEK
ncbi:MAG: 30S ribosome-binding factor RbfA [Anaerovoracaceae bacterium]